MGKREQPGLSEQPDNKTEKELNNLKSLFLRKIKSANEKGEMVNADDMIAEFNRAANRKLLNRSKNSAVQERLEEIVVELREAMDGSLTKDADDADQGHESKKDNKEKKFFDDTESIRFTPNEPPAKDKLVGEKPAEESVDSHERESEKTPSAEGEKLAENDPQDEIFKKFKNLGINPDDVKREIGDDRLSDGQLLFVLNDLQQLAVSYVRDRAAVKFDESQNNLRVDEKVKWEWNLLKPAEIIVKKTGALAKRAWNGIVREAKVAEYEQEVFNNKDNKKTMQEHLIACLPIVAQNARGFQYDVERKANGQFIINFLDSRNSAENGEKKENPFAEFNRVATEFSLMPAEDSFDGADEVKKKQFNKKKKEFDKLKAKALESLNEEKDSLDATQTMLKIDAHVTLSQYLAAHPDAEKELADMAGKSRRIKAFYKATTGKLLYAGVGFGLRTVGVSLLGFAAVPLVAAGLGGWLAKKRAQEFARKQESALRKKDYGVNSANSKEADAEKEEKLDGYHIKEVKTVNDKGDVTTAKVYSVTQKKREELRKYKDYANVENLNGRLETILARLDGNEASSNDNKELAAKHLDRLIDFIESRLDAGLVNFGEGKNRLSNQYDLTKNLGLAKVKREELISQEAYKKGAYKQRQKGTDTDGSPTFHELDFNRLFGMREEKVFGLRKEKIKKQMFFGAGIAAGFAVGGYLLRTAGEHWFGWGQHAVATKSDTGGGAGISNSAGQPGAFNQGPTYSADDIAPGKFSDSQVPPGPAADPAMPYSSDGGASGQVHPGTANVEQPVEPAVDPSKEIPNSTNVVELSTVHKGEGIEHAFIRQLKANPTEFGFNGDASDEHAVAKWAGVKAHQVALDNGYAATGKEIRVAVAERVAYILENKNGKISVAEYVKDEDGKFNLFEQHESGSDFETESEDYEYKHEKAGKDVEMANQTSDSDTTDTASDSQTEDEQGSGRTTGQMSTEAVKQPSVDYFALSMQKEINEYEEDLSFYLKLLEEYQEAEIVQRKKLADLEFLGPLETTSLSREELASQQEEEIIIKERLANATRSIKSAEENVRTLCNKISVAEYIKDESGKFNLFEQHESGSDLKTAENEHGLDYTTGQSKRDQTAALKIKVPKGILEKSINDIVERFVKKEIFGDNKMSRETFYQYKQKSVKEVMDDLKINNRLSGVQTMKRWIDFVCDMDGTASKTDAVASLKLDDFLKKFIKTIQFKNQK